MTGSVEDPATVHSKSRGLCQFLMQDSVPWGFPCSKLVSTQIVRTDSKTEEQDCGPSTQGFVLKSVAKSAADQNRGLPVMRNMEPETEAVVLERYGLNSVNWWNSSIVLCTRSNLKVVEKSAEFDRHAPTTQRTIVSYRYVCLACTINKCVCEVLYLVKHTCTLIKF
jgi:hypothetical protein